MVRRELGQQCCSHDSKKGAVDPRWRRALWIALAINAAMFLVEMVAGAAADSRALYADALDFFSDAANYAISLGVAGLALVWRARAALFKGATLLLLGFWVILACVWAVRIGSMPEAVPMGVVGLLALAANVFVALTLYRFRSGDANMRSVWICSRNDAIGNIAVVAAAIGVFGTGTAWPDIMVATIMAALGISGGWNIVRLAKLELREVKAQQVSPA